MNNLDFTFLTEDQIFGKNQLDILKKYGTKCAITDFAILLGGSRTIEYYTEEGIKSRASGWITKTPDGNYWVCYVDKYGSKNQKIADSCDYGARPALPYSSISKVFSKKEKNGIFEVEYGEYPQTIVSEYSSSILESAYLKGTMTKTGKSYTTDSFKYNNGGFPFRAREHIEYAYNGKKYIRFVGDSDFVGAAVLSDGRIIKEGEVYWVEVEPIKWIIDEKEDIALSKKILFRGIPFNHKMLYQGNFDETIIKWFMNTHFAKDIIPSNIISKQKKENNEKISEILKDIDNYLEKYLGNNKEKITKQIKEVINKKISDYNSKLEKIESLKITTTSLTLENNDVKYYYSKLVMELTTILDKLKQYFDNYKSSYEVINIINNLINILNNNEYDKDNLTDLYENFITIKEVILPYIDNNQDIINKLNTILNNTKKDVINNLSILEIDELENIKINDKENKPKEELLLELRKNIQPILIELNNLVRNKDIKSEIEKEYYNIMNNNYSESKNKLIGRYLNLTNILARDIKNKTDNQEDLKKLEQIINFNIDYRQDIDGIISKLYQIINSLYGMLFNIEESQEKESLIDDYKIEIDKLR